jgi:hypothetical protein
MLNRQDTKTTKENQELNRQGAKAPRRQENERLSAASSAVENNLLVS